MILADHIGDGDRSTAPARSAVSGGIRGGGLGDRLGDGLWWLGAPATPATPAIPAPDQCGSDRGHGKDASRGRWPHVSLPFHYVFRGTPARDPKNRLPGNSIPQRPQGRSLSPGAALSRYALTPAHS